MTTLKERLQNEAVVLTSGDIQDMAENDTDTAPFIYSDDALAFFRQELLALAEEVEKMKIPKPTCYCREYTLGAHDCGITSNEAVVDAAALIRTKADELV